MRHFKSVPGILTAALLLSITGAWAGRANNSGNSKIPKPPETRKVEVTETLHGVTVSDPYRWLEDQDSPDTRKWIDEQNAYTHSIIDQYPGRDDLKKQISSLLRIDTISTPSHRGDRYFFSRRKANQNLNVIYVREKGVDSVLVDPNPITPDDKALYYTKYINKVGPRAYYHVIGTDPKDDKELFGSKYGPTEFIGTE